MASRVSGTASSMDADHFPLQNYDWEFHENPRFVSLFLLCHDFMFILRDFSVDPKNIGSVNQRLFSVHENESFTMEELLFKYIARMESYPSRDVANMILHLLFRDFTDSDQEINLTEKYVQRDEHAQLYAVPSNVYDAYNMSNQDEMNRMLVEYQENKSSTKPTSENCVLSAHMPWVLSFAKQYFVSKNFREKFDNHVPQKGSMPFRENSENYPWQQSKWVLYVAGALVYAAQLNGFDKFELAGDLLLCYVDWRQRHTRAIPDYAHTARWIQFVSGLREMSLWLLLNRNTRARTMNICRNGISCQNANCMFLHCLGSADGSEVFRLFESRPTTPKKASKKSSPETTPVKPPKKAASSYAASAAAISSL